MSNDQTGLQLRSLVKQSGELELSLTRVPVAAPGPDEVMVRVEAAPINPSDLALMFAAADTNSAKASGDARQSCADGEYSGKVHEGDGGPRRPVDAGGQ